MAFTRRCGSANRPPSYRRLRHYSPLPPDNTICSPISARIGNVKNNDPGLVEPVAVPVKAISKTIA
jgi:hypothetical protein